MNFEVLVGLVGLTLVISMGSIFDGVRSWLLSFQHPSNLFRVIGEAMSCPMCAGMWVGIVWALHAGDNWMNVLMYGGLVSIATTTVTMVIGGAEKLVEMIPEPNRRAEVLRRMLEARGVHLRGDVIESDDEADEDE